MLQKLTIKQMDLRAWLIQQQGDLTGEEIAEQAGIAPQTWSKFRNNRQDLSSDLLWRCMRAIAFHRPDSQCALIVRMIDNQSESSKFMDD